MSLEQQTCLVLPRWGETVKHLQLKRYLIPSPILIMCLPCSQKPTDGSSFPFEMSLGDSSIVYPNKNTSDLSAWDQASVAQGYEVLWKSRLGVYPKSWMLITACSTTMAM